MNFKTMRTEAIKNAMHFLYNIALFLICLYIQNIHTADIDQACTGPMLSFTLYHSVLHVYMTVQVICGMPPVKQLIETCKTFVRQIVKIAVSQARCMCKQDIHCVLRSFCPMFPEKAASACEAHIFTAHEFLYTLLHLLFRVHVATLVIAHRASEPCDTDHPSFRTSISEG